MNQETKIYHIEVNSPTRALKLDVRSNDANEAIDRAVTLLAEDLEFYGTIYTPNTVEVEKDGNMIRYTDLQIGGKAGEFTAKRKFDLLDYKVVQHVMSGVLLLPVAIAGIGLGYLIAVLQGAIP